MILPNITVKRGFSQAMKYWKPVQIAIENPYVFGWLWWNFELPPENQEYLKPEDLETHSYCEAWSAG
jgi:hypothetical protein